MSVLQLYGVNEHKCLENYWHFRVFYYSAPEYFMHAVILYNLEGMFKMFSAYNWFPAYLLFFLPTSPFQFEVVLLWEVAVPNILFKSRPF